MHVKEDLHNGHLRMGSEQAEELSALLAQAEFGDYNQNTAKYWYSELCGEEPSTATNRYNPLASQNMTQIPSVPPQVIVIKARPTHHWCQGFAVIKTRRLEFGHNKLTSSG